VAGLAAPDHKIRQCILRSALFPGRADGGFRAIRGMRTTRGWVSGGVPYPLGGSEKISKINFEIPAFSAFLQTQIVSSVVSLRLSIRH